MTPGAAAILGVAVPMAGAPLLYVLRGRALAPWVAATAIVGTLAAAGRVVADVWTIGAHRYALGAWPAPLGIELNVDGLAALMLATTAVIMGAVCLYTAPLRRRDAGPSPADGGFWALLLFLWAALNGLFLSNDLFNLYVTLELMGLAAVAMVALDGRAEALAAGMRYLLVSWLGSMAYLIGVAFLYAEHGSLALDVVGASLGTGPGAWTALVAITLGLSLKTALFPFHGWLPAAHANAPTPVSALLSSLVVKASFYVLLRLWVSVFPAVLVVPLVQLVGAFGALAIVWGALLAIRQERLKLIVAFSTVSQLGYLFVLFPVALGGAGDPDSFPPGPYARGGDATAVLAWDGGVYFAVSHAVAKAAMFLAAGSVLQVLGHDRVSGFSGLAERSPTTVLAFALAGLSLVGLPPTGGFLAKWWLVAAAIERGQWGWAAVMLSGSLLTAAYVFRVLGAALRRGGEDGREAASGPDVPWSMAVASLALALVAVLLGHWGAGPLRLLEASRGFPW